MTEPIAIVGVACRFPGESTSPSKFWELLKNPRDVLKDFNDPARPNLSRFHDPRAGYHGSTTVAGKSYLLSEDFRHFDAAFFNTNGREADGIDPQQRILMEVVYEALESAGWPMEKISGTKTSVHVGVMNSDYQDIALRDSETMLKYHATGTHRSALSNRISYFFNLHGLSVTLDTACSSSLVALHQAVQGLQTGETTAAIVGGANLLLDPTMFIAESALQMLSADARSRMWDKSANGYARGEGFAALVLKPLKRAVADGDRIEAVIRATGANSDGHTPGITMPSASAQTEMIRQTYERAGLDPVKDGCDWFEAHGTGTLAGDPIEAEGIRDAFFPVDQRNSKTDAYAGKRSLPVGSVKTVIGHTEGCAGLAGVIKAMLAIKHQIMPANMHFKELNPEIAQFYDHLNIPTQATPFPQSDRPLIASINSFGFGGTNAHAILESYANPAENASHDPERTFIGPLLFSAHASVSLLDMVKDYHAHLRAHENLDLDDLAWTLQTRRSELAARQYFVGSSRQKVLASMEKFIEDAEATPGSTVGLQMLSRIHDEPLGVLGIFTGQGAQYATMGRQLLVSSPVFRTSLQRCEDVLSKLPDGPDWSMIKELTAEESVSRISEAALSQPLCTAIQIGLIDVLTEAGIHFNAVVGHSSGEIAATYAAGIIDATAAMQIAYYRGYHAWRACGASGQKGRMLAVGISYNDALSFCKLPDYRGRIAVAASNSPLSVTLSGDLDAIDEAKAHFDSRKTFARVLKTDTAYHSHHMQPCSEPYLKSLSACRIHIKQPKADCTWISSVRGDTQLLEDDLSSLAGQYWVDNMCNPVLFSQAVEWSHWHGGPFDFAFEIGPHPALKGPAEQTLKAATGQVPPYTGVMKRGGDEIEALSSALSLIWAKLGPKVDFERYRRAFERRADWKPQPLGDLPTYAWDHRTLHWRESRISRNHRLRQDKLKDLLGRRCADDSDEGLRWRNVLNVNELKWLRGHVFQGQVLFPASGHIAMVLEAAVAIAGDRPVKLFELHDIALHRAIVLPDNSSGVESVLEIKFIEDARATKGDVTEAEYTCFVCQDESSGSLVKAGSGRLLIEFGLNAGDQFPERLECPAALVDVDIDRFYSTMSATGLEYTELFHGLRNAKRCLGYSRTSASWNADDLIGGFTIHPASLDVAFQTLYVAFASPASDDIWAPYLPVKIKRLAVDPRGLTADVNGTIAFETDTYLNTATASRLEGDMHIFDSTTNAMVAQVDGITMQAMSEPGPENDALLFSSIVWEDDIFAEQKQLELEAAHLSDISLVEALDRACLYWWRSLNDSVADEEIKSLDKHFQYMFATFKHLLRIVNMGRHPTVKREWLQDSHDTMMTISEPHMERADMRLIHVVGRNLPSVIKGETQLLEVMLEDDLLNRFYMEGSGMSSINHAIAAACKQFAHKFPRAKYLEIGAGTGGTTRAVFDAIGNSFSSYTYTDVSAGFFANAAKKFEDHVDKMHFRGLDIEKDPAEQDFKEHGYDIVLAANVLHATSKMERTLQNTRKLLRPGGMLVLLETTGQDILMPQFVMGGLPGWWAGASDGRHLTPALSVVGWDENLQQTGFSGVDHAIHDTEDEGQHTFSAIISQAVDGTVQMLRDPLAAENARSPAGDLLIVGGRSLQTARIVTEIQKLLPAWRRRTKCIKDLQVLRDSPMAPMTSVICLADLDQPLFSETETAESFEALQELFVNAESLLWVTKGRFSSKPRSNMAVGVGRALKNEMPELDLQFLDFMETPSPSATAAILARAFLRLSNASDIDSDVLWALEPEIMVDGERTLIPRVKPHNVLNDRCNADRRPISATLDARSTGVQLKMGEKGPRLAGTGLTLSQPISRGYCRLRTVASLQMPGGDGLELHLLLARDLDSGKDIIALNASVASLLAVPEKNRIVLPESIEPTPEILHAISLELYSDVIDKCPFTGKHTLFYEPPELIAQAASGKEVTLITSQESRAKAGWTFMHPRSSTTHLKRIIPGKTDRVMTFGEDLPHLVKAALPPLCSMLDVNMAKEILGHPEPRSFIKVPMAQLTDHGPAIDVIGIDDFVGQSTSSDKACVLDWTALRSVKALVPALSTDQLLFPDRTYLLMGLTGDLGLSLAKWMIEHGARHIVLASRSAKIDGRWLDAAAASGANVRLCKADASDRDSLESMIDEVKSTMPPVAGVCNGTMLLSDKLFADMDDKAWNTAIKPKVLGTKYLDELFSDTQLDFFIFFSSLGSIIGNINQSNYHAANLYATSLAANRRERGLAASVMHLAMVADVGHVAHHGQNMEKHLRNMFYMPLSERNVHHAFAEAIVSGRPDSNSENEIIVGCEIFHDTADATRRPPWENNPMFGHMIVEDAQKSGQQASGSGHADAMQALEQAHTEETALPIVIEAFSQKLQFMMQLTNVNPNVSVVELGCDSLLAIEIRGWFSKELKVDVPVLKILSGETVTQICLEVTKKYLATRMLQAHAEAKTKPIVQEEPKAKPVRPAKTDISDDSSAPQDTPPTSMSSSVTTATDFTPSQDASEQIDDEDVADEAVEFSVVAPASMAQSRLWFMGDFLEDPTTFNITASYSLQGPLRVPRLKRALVQVIVHHKTLQSCFFEDPEKRTVMQGIRQSPKYQMKFIESASEEQIAREYDLLRTRAWDLEKGETFGVTVLSRDAEHHVLLFGYHHMVMDGMSWHTFLRDLGLAYRMQALSNASKPYIDFATSQQRAIQEGAFEPHLQFWQEHHHTLPETLPLLPLAGSTARTPLRHYETYIVSRDLDLCKMQKIRQSSQAVGATPFHFFLGSIQALLARFLKLEDVCIGIADANRTDDKFKETVGFFINLLPVRFRAGLNDSFSEVVERTRSTMLEALSHSDVPFDLILDRLKVPRPTTHSPLFQVAVNYRMGEVLHRPLGEFTLENTRYDDARNAYDLLFNITEAASGSKLEVIVQRQLYTVEAAEALADCYLSLLESASHNADQPIRQLPLTQPDTITSALSVGRGPRIEIERPATVFEWFMDVAKQYPNDLAIQDTLRSWTYSQLMTELTDIAGAIHAKKLPPGSSVLVFCRPSNYIAACMLAILQTGCVYVPLDPILPPGRRAAIVQNCKPALVLCDEEMRGAADRLVSGLEERIEVINVEAITPALNGSVSTSLAKPDDPAFIFYTSGSTGTPKGIILTQAGYVNHLAVKTKTLNMQREVALQQSSTGFDMSLAQTLCALLTGGTSVVAPASARGDPVAIAQLIQESKVTFTYGTPSEYFMMFQNGREHLEEAKSWKKCCIGGEMVGDNVVDEFRSLERDDFQLIICYGPTEISVSATLEPLSLKEGEKNVPYRIGKTLPNYSVYVVNEDCELMPSNLSGEICIGGAGVGRGYLHLPEQTQAKFVQDPWASEADIAKGWTMMYRTGDKGYLLDDGSLVFLGRMDESMVKLPGGLRVETDEVANCIVKTAAGLISHAVVTVRGNPAFLVAHILFAQDRNASPAELKRIREELPLPQYMKPAMMIPLKELLYNSNGKIDRKALSALPLPDLERSEHSGPTQRLSLAETELRLLWERVLPRFGGDPLNADSDFFMQGGSSLLLMNLQGEIKKSMNISIKVRDLYESSTLGEMAARVTAKKHEQASERGRIDWKKETAASESLPTASPDEGKDSFVPPQREVLLTGAASFLGQAILDVLVKHDKVSRIHCIALSADDEANVTSHANSEKVITYEGDLRAPLLGLSPSDCAHLQGTIDLILHAGHFGHCMNNYSSVRAPNVLATRSLLEIAASSGIPFHFVSSNRCTLLSGKNEIPPISLSRYHPPTDGSDGFIASKWACEQVLENSAKILNALDIGVHRPCALVGSSAPNEDALNALIKYSKTLKAVPTFENFDGFLDFKDVEKVAEELVHNALAPQPKDNVPVRYFHYSSGERVPFDKFAAHMERLSGGEGFEQLSVQEWIQRAEDAGVDPLISGYLEAVAEMGGTVRFPFMGMRIEETK